MLGGIDLNDLEDESGIKILLQDLLQNKIFLFL